MALPITENTVAETYERVKNSFREVNNRLPGYLGWCDVTSPSSFITDDLVPFMRGISGRVPHSSLFPQAWIDALAAYASTQTLNPPADWVAEYDAAGDAVRAAITAAVGVLPTHEGKLLVRTMATDGASSYVDLTAVDLAPLKVALLTVDSALA